MAAKFVLMVMAVTTIVATTANSEVIEYYGPLESSKLSTSAKQYILCEHNRVRASVANGTLSMCSGQPTASNMQALCWCDELEEKAQLHADNCGGPPHDSRTARGSNHISDVGQNMMLTMISAPIDESIDAFTEECSGYTYSSNTCNAALAGPAQTCGHYTAMVWANTQCIACAYNPCESDTNGRFVCNYGPGGNIQGQSPYKQGQPCTQCHAGQKCIYGSLCASCDGLDCGSDAVTPVSTGEACNDKIGTSTCSQYQSILGVCNTGNVYYNWACQNCKQTCNVCGGLNVGQVCNTGYSLSSDYCKVHSSENAAECVKQDGKKGLFYVGTQSIGGNNCQCKNWNLQNRYHPFEFPERNTTQAVNYCRNPGMSGDKPWCYVDTSCDSKGWAYCDLPSC